MAYSNDQRQIQAGLTNYVGALLTSSTFENIQATKHSVVVLLAEEILKLSKDKEGYFDMFTIKPLLRAVYNIFSQRLSMLSALPRTDEVVEQILMYKQMTENLKALIEKIQL